MTTREEYLRSSYAVIVTELVPPILRTPALADEPFALSLGLLVDGIVNFAPSGTSFHRSALMKGVRKASAAGSGEAEVPDEAGRFWKVKITQDSDAVSVAIASDDIELHVPHLAAVAERAEVRLALLDGEAKRVGLPDAAKQYWRDILSVRALHDDEVHCLSADLNQTPVAVSAAIKDNMRGETASFEVLVPRSPRYYERLIGEWRGQTNIRDYAEQVVPGFLAGLLRWNQVAGLRHALIACSHSAVGDQLAATPIEPDTFDKIAKWAARDADPMTRCALVELGLLHGGVSPEGKGLLSELAASLLVPVGASDELFEIFSRLFIFVYGQLAQTKCLPGKPVFWKRMAAFAQAALIFQCMAPNRGAFNEFTEKLLEIRIRTFSRQVYTELREGPLWQGHFALLPQIRNEFVGRVIHRARLNAHSVKALELGDVILGEGPLSLSSSVHLALSSMAGPLEDNIPLVVPLDENGRAILTEQLSQPKLTMNSFAGLVNCALLVHLPVEFADMAATALERAQYRFETESNEMFIVVLTGLATCASVTRSTALANAIFTLIRFYRRFWPAQLDLNNALRIGSIACAAHTDLAGWGEAMGSLMSDFAFQSLTVDEASALENHIVGLCDLVPELWAMCGQALAAAQSVAA